MLKPFFHDADVTEHGAVFVGKFSLDGCAREVSVQEYRPNVLIVDDEPQICKLIDKALVGKGMQCTSISEPRLAAQLLESERFSVVVTDISMPHINGFELLALARRNDPDCKVILVTGQSGTYYLAKALSSGAYDYLQKPFDLNHLVKVVRKAVADRSPYQYLPIKAARAIQLESQLRKASLESIRALVQAVEAKDPYTRRHSEQVTHYAVHVAEFLNAGEELVDSIRVAALLHDIGKIGTPDNILTKVGSLDEDEFQYIKRHPALGAEILEHISMFATEAKLVRHHHERWDGRGYPDGLSSEDIPFGARIICVADAMDAMLMCRTYKSAYSMEKMLGELTGNAGTQFDPAVAAGVVKWCETFPEKMILSDQAA